MVTRWISLFFFACTIGVAECFVLKGTGIIGTHIFNVARSRTPIKVADSDVVFRKRLFSPKTEFKDLRSAIQRMSSNDVEFQLYEGDEDGDEVDKKPTYENESWNISKEDDIERESLEEQDIGDKDGEGDNNSKEIDLEKHKFPSDDDMTGYEVDENGFAWKMPSDALELSDPDSPNAVPIFILIYLLKDEYGQVNIDNVIEEHEKYAAGHSRWKHSEVINLEEGRGIAMMFAGTDMDDIEESDEAISNFMEFDPFFLNQMVLLWNKMQVYPPPEEYPAMDGKTKPTPEQLLGLDEDEVADDDDNNNSE